MPDTLTRAPPFPERSFEISRLELPEQRRRLAQRRLQFAQGLIEADAVEPARAAAVLGEEPAARRAFQQRLLDRMVLGSRRRRRRAARAGEVAGLVLMAGFADAVVDRGNDLNTSTRFGAVVALVARSDGGPALEGIDATVRRRVGAFFGALFLVYGAALPYLPVLLDARGSTPPKSD